MEDIFLYNQIRRVAAEDIFSSSDRTAASRAEIPYRVSASAGRCISFLPCCRTNSWTILEERAPLLGVLRLVRFLYSSGSVFASGALFCEPPVMTRCFRQVFVALADASARTGPS